MSEADVPQRSYAKPALTHADQMERLASRGMVFSDEERGRRYLRRIGYYRLSPYALPFRLMDGTERFRTGTQFDEVLALYIFDRKLRLIFWDALERFEVAVRAALTDHMATAYGDPHWYTRAEHFRHSTAHHRLLHECHGVVSKQREGDPEDDADFLEPRSALEHYVRTYDDPPLPPSWLMFEELSFGAIESMYRNLARASDQQAIAASLNLKRPVLESWLKSFRRVRNICAHHGRLWNRGLGVKPMIPKSSSTPWLSTPITRHGSLRLYAVACCLQSALHTLSPNSEWAARLRALLEEYPDVPLGPMGFPENWFEDRFWPC